MHRSDANDDKVGHQTVTSETIDEIAHAARADQEQCKKRNPGEIRAQQVTQQPNETQPDAQRQQPAADRFRQRSSEAEKRPRIFSQDKLNQTAGQRRGMELVETAPGNVLGSLIATNGENQNQEDG